MAQSNLTAGYRMEAAAYEYVDMAGATVHDTTGAINIPFGFSFYGTSQSQLRISQSGVLYFSAGGDPGDDNVDLTRTPAAGQPQRPSGPVIATLWDALLPGDNGQVRYKAFNTAGVGPANALAVEWKDFFYQGDGNVDPITFQAVLYADGRIRFNYANVTSSVGLSSYRVSNGASATVGLWKGGAAGADSITLPAGKYVPGPHSLFSSTTGLDAYGFYANGISESNDSYVRLAWDTGGAAWDLGVVQEYAGGIHSLAANALRDAFIDSIADQIRAADAAGKVFNGDEVLLALNAGGAVSINAGSAGVFRADNGTYTVDAGIGAVDHYSSNRTIDLSSNSLPVGTNLESVFQSARGESPRDPVYPEDIHIVIDALDNGAGGASAFAAGRYVVELFFAETAALNPGEEGVIRSFDIVIEGVRMLSEYNPFDDRAKITQFDADELDAEAAGFATGVVKRYMVDVTDGSDADASPELDILLYSLSAFDPILSGVRILRAAAPRVADVVVKGSAWAPGVEYSFAAMVGQGMQLRPIPTQGADTIEIHFDGPVSITADALELARTVRNLPTPPNSNVAPETRRFSCDDASMEFAYDAANYIARWTFPATGPTSLADGKYAILLNTAKATGSGGAPLDGDWKAGHGFASPATPDAYGDDLPEAFIVGDGASSSASAYFRLNFALLAGDFNGDGAVTTTAWTWRWRSMGWG
ncbi:MAG: hypothetical protein DCC67_16640 [Planctomycetota bacterium]|nr:MAG: hypothetical protein DCC67_16640 [Planctomycetota bacterium]